jgi:hypothetical protein
MRNLGFDHFQKWASPKYHQASGLRQFDIMKRGHLAGMLFHYFAIHFVFSFSIWHTI